MTRFNEEIARLLADPTRLKIYREVANAQPEALTVAEIAEGFGLHPNVARMHLEKLAGVGLLASSYRKASGSGRPAREYRLGKTALNLQYPSRDYELLAEISLSSLEDDTRSAAVARKKGREIGEQALARAGRKTAVADVAAFVSVFEQLAEEQGLNATIEGRKDGKIQVKIFNCVFRELSSKDSKVCEIHKNVLTGICEALFGKVRISSYGGIAEGQDQCNFVFSFKLKKVS